MNKNFKKIIATVAALAMASSSFVAMAATYPDVTPDAACYSAVEQLSALGIMEGFDDGTFKPEEKVTRAQMAKLVVGAKNLLAAAESNTTVKFDDVKADHWAVGYVAEGVAQQIINGTSDTTFDPDATVTFAQATKMLVNAAGYEEYAQIAGGWPNGYLTWGSTLGVNKGITGVGNDTELTRAQVAQMLINAMKAPVLEIEKYTTTANGQKVPEYKQMNGEDNKFESLLTNEWDTYEVYGSVVGTSRAAGSNLKAGEVNYEVKKSKNYDGIVYPKTTSPATDTLSKVASGNSGAEDFYLEYTYALISLNDDDEASIVYIESAGKNQYVEFDQNLYAKTSYTAYADAVVGPPAVAEVPASLKLYRNETTINTKPYELDKDVRFIINGVAINPSTRIAQATAEAYLDGTKGSYENAYLIDSPQGTSASTDGKYDYITFDMYETDVVDEVDTRTNGDIIVYTENGDFTIKADNEEKTYSFMLTDGTELEVTDLQKNDVLSIKANPLRADLDDSLFYEIIVSRDTVEGKVTAQGTNAAGDTVYTVGDAEYKFANSGSLTLLETYTLYLDKDGNIAKEEVLASSVNYAIVDRYFKPAGDDVKVRLILKDGSKVDYAIKADNTGLDARMDINEQYVLVDGSGAIFTADAAAVGTKGTPGYVPERIKTIDRFVQYSVNSSNEVTLNPAAEVVVDSGLYKERTSRIGNYGIADTSVILNASDYAKDPSEAVAVVDKSVLVEDLSYVAAFLGKKASGTYPMVVMLTGNTGYTKSSPLQVATGTTKKTSVDGSETHIIPVATADGTADLVLADGVKITGTSETTNAAKLTEVKNAIAEGVAFVAATNTAGEVEEITVVFDPTSATHTTMLAASYDLTEVSASGFALTYLAANSDVKFAMAPVISRSATEIELAKKLSSSFNITQDSGESLTYASGAKAICYNAAARDGFKVSAAETMSDVAQSKVTTNGRVPSNDTQIDWTSPANTVRYALVRVYDGDVQEVYSISFE